MCKKGKSAINEGLLHSRMDIDYLNGKDAELKQSTLSFWDTTEKAFKPLVISSWGSAAEKSQCGLVYYN